MTLRVLIKVAEKHRFGPAVHGEFRLRFYGEDFDEVWHYDSVEERSDMIKRIEILCANWS